jgi:hypothetical protein
MDRALQPTSHTDRAGAAQLQIHRELPATAALNDGTVLIVGGSCDPSAPSTAELFDPALDRFVLVGSLNFPRIIGVTATLLLDGTVLINGGQDNLSPPFPAEICDPASRSFRLTGIPAVVRSLGATATRLPSGNVLFIGGQLLPNANVPAVLNLVSATHPVSSFAIIPVAIW